MKRVWMEGCDFLKLVSSLKWLFYDDKKFEKKDVRFHVVQQPQMHLLFFTKALQKSMRGAPKWFFTAGEFKTKGFLKMGDALSSRCISSTLRKFFVLGKSPGLAAWLSIFQPENTKVNQLWFSSQLNKSQIFDEMKKNSSKSTIVQPNCSTIKSIQSIVDVWNKHLIWKKGRADVGKGVAAGHRTAIVYFRSGSSRHPVVLRVITLSDGLFPLLYHCVAASSRKRYARPTPRRSLGVPFNRAYFFGALPFHSQLICPFFASVGLYFSFYFGVECG